MVDHLISILAGVFAFLMFIIIFARRDHQGKRGSRLAACSHPTAPTAGCRCQALRKTTALSHRREQDEPSGR